MASPSKPRLMTQKGPKEKNHPVRLYLDRVASQDLGEYPEWDLGVSIGSYCICLHTTQSQSLVSLYSQIQFSFVVVILSFKLFG